MHASLGQSRPPSRRGVLLLVVLSMLTLFIMLGTAYIVAATRARETARAYARLTFGGDEARIPHARLADMVFLSVLRGGSLPTGQIAGLQFESILADKYGPETLAANVSIDDPAEGDGVPPPILTVSATLVSGSVRPTDLNGRVLTFTAPGRPATSHRILRATRKPDLTNALGTAFRLSVEGPRRAGSWMRPRPGRAIINGREFAGVPAAGGTSSNEAWDGFDEHNPFLAQVGPGDAPSKAVVSRISFYPSLKGSDSALTSSTRWIPNGADNDNDGVVDGLFLDFGIPSVADTGGRTVDLRASVLVVDLDGRFNVNAHGALSPILYPATNTNWTTAAGVAGALDDVPLGSGYGPAEIQANLGSGNEPQSPAGVATRLFDGSSLQPGENPRWALTLGARADALVGRRASGSRYSERMETPRVGALEARYGYGAAPSAAPPSRDIQLGQPGFPYARPGEPGIDDAASRINDRRCLPGAGGATDAANYGVPPTWWTGSTSYAWWVSGTVSGVTQPLPRGIYNSPPDLHGRMKTLTLPATGAAFVPHVVFVQPEWSSASEGREARDDPYELRLDTRQGYGGWLRDPMTGGVAPGAFKHNPFTPAELEPVLRPYDIDTNRLPPRLAAILGSAAEESRVKITTESWDTTAITGSAAILLFGTTGGTNGWLQKVAGSPYGGGPSAATSGVIGGEVARGERFDLNRALAASDGGNVGYRIGALRSSAYHLQRAAYCKDLYTLLVALAPDRPRTAVAQWAANVAEWRDADSRVVPFEYDTNPLDGWQVDGDVRTNEGGDRAVVWGAERPEIVILDAFAWRNAGMAAAGGWVVLHRPWKATAYASGSAAIAAEPCDHALDTMHGGTARNVVDLGRKSGNSPLPPSNTYPIWRLRVVAGGSTSYLRLDTGSSSTGEIVDPTILSGTLAPGLGVDSTITLASGSVVVTGSAGAVGSVFLDTPGARLLPRLRVLGAAEATLFLERLSDPLVELTPGGTVLGTSITGSAVWFGTAPDTSPVRYTAVDSAVVPITDTSIGTDVVTGQRVCRTMPKEFWQSPAPTPVSATNGGTFPPVNTGPAAWLPWPNRPFVSSAELMLVPQGDALEMLQGYRRLTPADSGVPEPGKGSPVPLDLLFDAVHVPTRFAAIHHTTTSDLSASTGIDNVVTPVNQLSSFREPGRVNLNTVSSADVWNAVVAGPFHEPLVKATEGLGLNASGSAVSAQSLFQILRLSGSGVTVRSDTTTTVSGSSTAVSGSSTAVSGSSTASVLANPLHGIYTATRLANVATPRSNVFAVWITLRESVADDPDSVRYHRAFYIVDRSIPVGYEVGRDHNVWDCVRVRRIVE